MCIVANLFEVMHHVWRETQYSPVISKLSIKAGFGGGLDYQGRAQMPEFLAAAPALYRR